MLPLRKPGKSSRNAELSFVVMSIVSAFKVNVTSVAAAIKVLPMYTPKSVPLNIAIVILFF